MMHGAVNFRFGYLPLLADYLLCWGYRQKKMLGFLGGPSERMLISGAPQLSNKLIGDEEPLRSRISLKPNQKLVVLGTNPLTVELRTDLVQLFGSALEGQHLVQGLIRLHPSESKMEYQTQIEDYPHLIFDDGSLFTFEESLSVADMVCVYNSAYGLDAIIKGKPLCVLNISEAFLGQGKDFIDYGSFPEMKSIRDFEVFLERWLNDSALQEEVRILSTNYAKEYCASFGEDAAKRSIEIFRSSSKPKS